MRRTPLLPTRTRRYCALGAFVDMQTRILPGAALPECAAFFRRGVLYGERMTSFWRNAGLFIARQTPAVCNLTSEQGIFVRSRKQNVHYSNRRSWVRFGTPGTGKNISDSREHPGFD